MRGSFLDFFFFFFFGGGTGESTFLISTLTGESAEYGAGSLKLGLELSLIPPKAAGLREVAG